MRPRPGTRPIGTITRGTTGHNRLRRSDRWIAAVHGPLLRSWADEKPLVVDLGYGASHITTYELFTRLRRVCPSVEVVGVEIDPERVAAAKPYEREGLSFARGGFELPVARPPMVVRAFNVLRQYGEAAAWEYWDLLRGRIHPAGVIVEGTCSEIGHRAVWAALGAGGPRTLTFAARFTGFERPSDLAERLPKTLIHRNVPGEPIHAFLADWDRAWATCAPFGPYGYRQRWIRTAELLARDWPVATAPPAGGPSRWRLGELTLPWPAVGP
ncbi:class I SAM-dependent methyltransferase [Planotetraspora sp. A-T 1434]|uniref:class I SAM-dependent methyltransferase n=1 Tax=Planotetraspora sp. A-T 1434 TaxID=2979219 RepID=UPI0021BEAA75|nr:class I SAM-dependent methyltransferase [Planotetraspora sp. A-T 1434]MCT9934789.1 class I SAM-dependent methyltransferase [Planotetraspora sp. A-T 1434]